MGEGKSDSPPFLQPMRSPDCVSGMAVIKGGKI